MSNLKNKKVVLFRRSIDTEGGAERLMLEVAKDFRNYFSDIYVLSLRRKTKIFDREYDDLEIKSILNKSKRGIMGKIWNSIRGIFALRKFIKKNKISIVVGQSPEDAEIIYFATLFMSCDYHIFIHGSKFWFPSDATKYSIIFRKSFEEIRKSVPGHKEFISKEKPRKSIFRNLLIFIRSLFDFISVRKAKNVFVLSDQMSWEVEKLYKRKAVVNKGGVNKKILSYKSSLDIKKELNISPNKKIILSVNRLDPRKRTDLSIKAFNNILSSYKNIHMIIVGEGEDKNKLKELIDDLEINNNVTMTGYVNENNLLDFYSSADIFIHPGWLDFDITVLEALAFNKKVVCSLEFEVDQYLKKLENNFIFRAFPDERSVTLKLKEALATTNKKTISKELIEKYTWDNYTKRLVDYL